MTIFISQAPKRIFLCAFLVFFYFAKTETTLGLLPAFVVHDELDANFESYSACLLYVFGCKFCSL